MASSNANGKAEKKEWVTSAFGDLREAKKEAPARVEKTAEFLPLSFYWLKDVAGAFIGHKNFPDALVMVFALICISVAVPFYPLPLLVPLAIALFALVMIDPYLGFLALLLFLLPAIIYQAPLLSWVFLVLVIASLFLTFPHYKTISFIFILIALPLSVLGRFAELPLFVVMALTVGNKRTAVATLIIFLSIAAYAGITGIQPSGPIVYDVAASHAPVVKSALMQYLDISKPAATLQNLGSVWSASFSSFWAISVTSHIFDAYALAGLAIAYSFPLIIVQIFVWIAVAFVINNFAVKSRYAYRGAVSSLFAIIIPIEYYLLSYLTGSPQTSME